MDAPLITIYVRHSKGCPGTGNEFYKTCKCRKHLRWSYLGKQYRKATKQRTWAGAERAKREHELSYTLADKPTEPDRPPMVRQTVESFLHDKQGQNLNPAVLKKYRRELERFRDFCEQIGTFYLAQVSLPELSEFRLSWEADYPSSTTRQKVQSRLRTFFQYALRAGFIHRNPALGMSSIKAEQVPTLPLTPEQFNSLLGAIPRAFPNPTKATRVHALVRCMRYSALGIGDAVRLERSKVQYDAANDLTRIVTSRAKTGVDISVPIPPDVARELLAVPNPNPRYLFWRTGNGNPQTAVGHWQTALRILFREAGMPEGHPHQLRDTAAVEWLNAGIPLEEVSRLLGHLSIKTTEKHYAPWVKSRQARLDSLVVATWKEGTGAARAS